MTESQILTLNERIKTVSTYFANLSAALMAAAAARGWTTGADWTALFWLVTAIGLLLISWQMLYLLEAILENVE